MPRLFTALEVPVALRTRLAFLQGGLSGVRWIDPENFHVTIRFIGDVDGAAARDVHAVLERMHREPVDVTLESLTVFGSGKPRAIVAGVRPSTALVALQAEQERLIRRIGLPAEPRKFMPHVTLARLRGPSPRSVADYLAMHAFLPMPPYAATRFVLLSSRDSIGGGPYKEEAAYPLREHP